MSIAFQYPFWLWLAALGIPCAIVGWLAFGAMGASRRLSAIALRVGLLALLAAMLAGISSIRTSDRLAVVAVVDVSGSVQSFATAPGPALDRVREYLRQASAKRGRADLLGIVVFDGSTTAIAAPQAGTAALLTSTAGAPTTDPNERPTDLLDRTWQTVVPTPNATDIEQALRLAAAMIPPDASGRLVLFSDGRQTSGDAVGAARSITGGASRPLPIDVVPIRYRVEHEVVVESLDSPTRAAAGAFVDVRVNLRASSPATGTLRLLQGGEEVRISDDPSRASRRVSLQPGLTTFVLSARLDAGRVHQLRAIFEPDVIEPGATTGAGAATDGAGISAAGGTGTAAASSPTRTPSDTIAANNSAEAFTITPGTGDILLIDGVGSDGSAGGGPGGILARTLTDQGITVQTIAPEGLSPDLVRMQAYDAIILQNAPADAFAPGALDSLQRYVTELGGGLVMIGGPNSFGAGAWRGSPIEPILPVKLDLPEQLVLPSAAMIIIMDTSGSMGWSVMGSSRSQQEIANEGAALAVRTMHKDDLVGVIEFNSDYSVVQPLAKNVDSESTARRLLSLAPNGGTNLPPALREAYRQMKDARAKIKHIIVLSDGGSQGRQTLPGIAADIAKDGIALSTIAVGDKADLPTMAKMAEAGGGVYYRVTDPNTLPRIFLRAAQIVRQPLIREEPFVPVMMLTGSPITMGLPTDPAMPALGGLVLTQARPPEENGQPTGVLYPMLTPKGEPVLGVWQAGLGQVAAFTSDAHNWGLSWVEWPGYRQFWTQLVRSIARPDSSRAGELTLRREGDAIVATLEMTDASGKPRDGVQISGSAFSPDGGRTALRMSQVASGVYEGRFAAPGAGNYLVTLTPQEGSIKLPPIVGGQVVPSGQEFRWLTSDDQTLSEIAKAGGGKVLSLEATELPNLWSRAGLVPTEARLPLWPLLIAYALALTLLDIGTRRVAWDRLISRKFGQSVMQEAAVAMADRTKQSGDRLAALRQRDAAATLKPTPLAETKALDNTDAQRVIDEARKRRQQAARARTAGGASATPAGPSTTPSPTATRSTEPASPPPPTPRPSPAAPIERSRPATGDTLPGETPMQAAKRRARERAGEP
jgi:Ca-activated chloride channel family protein